MPISKVSSSVAFRTLLELDEAETKVKSHPLIFVPYPSDNAMTSSDLYASNGGRACVAKYDLSILSKIIFVIPGGLLKFGTD